VDKLKRTGSFPIRLNDSGSFQSEDFQPPVRSNRGQRIHRNHLLRTLCNKTPIITGDAWELNLNRFLKKGRINMSLSHQNRTQNNRNPASPLCEMNKLPLVYNNRSLLREYLLFVYYGFTGFTLHGQHCHKVL
jgi:hypothetical protein